MNNKNRIGTCELCGREEVETTVHHLTPKEMGGTFLPSAYLCIPCHKQIHALYTNEELAARLNTIGKLQGDDSIRSFLKWIKKQPPGRMPKIRKAKSRRK
ncbi:HNH endonuclease [Peribacillus sp. SCS-26]|uniref:HNH endonuclease n=1 Tax=Paraperibacillus marinus TaxID=3115295 RepID=UPI003906A849